jgi:hypothetical protein
MQMFVTDGNCEQITLNDPFYCGSHPPNAKLIVNVAMSGMEEMEGAEKEEGKGEGRRDKG